MFKKKKKKKKDRIKRIYSQLQTLNDYPPSLNQRLSSMGREYDFTDIDLRPEDENKPDETNTQQNGVNGIKESRQESQNVTDTRQNPNIVSRVRNAMIKGLEDIFYT